MIATGEVDAIVLAAGRGERLALGPKAWLTLGGRTLLERAVTTMRAIPASVFVGVSADHVDRARASCGADATVVPGGATHRETMLAALRAGVAPLVLIHDVAHPFVTPALARQVVETARDRGAAVAAVRATSSAYHRVGEAPMTRLDASEVWTVRRPFAFRRDDFMRGLAMSAGNEGLSVILGRVGVSTTLVPTASWNIKITTADDWALAGAIDQGLRPV
jgi:2-C-methyl-D-erythritol 4-phosphate cytidylyltransferase